MSIAVILGEGKTVADYNPKDYPDAYVLGVNTVYPTYKKLTRKSLKMDGLVCMDQPKDFRKNNKWDQLLETPKDITRIVHWANQWAQIAKKEGWETVWLNSSKIPSTRPDLWDKWEFVHGSFSVTAAIYYAMKKGYKEIYVFGHDLSRDWNMYNPSTVSRAIKEVNFAVEILAKQGGKLYLAEDSNLWNEQTDKGEGLRAEKLAKKKAKKKEGLKEVED